MTGQERKELLAKAREMFDEINIEAEGENVLLDAEHKAQRASALQQYRLLLKRDFVNTYRDLSVIKAQFIQAAAVGILVGFLYYRLPFDQTAIGSRLGLFFFLLMDRVFILAGGSMALFSAVCVSLVVMFACVMSDLVLL